MRTTQTHNWKPEMQSNSTALKLNKFHPLCIPRQVHTVSGRDPRTQEGRGVDSTSVSPLRIVRRDECCTNKVPVTH